jgi:hypothetical protein
MSFVDSAPGSPFDASQFESKIDGRSGASNARSTHASLTALLTEPRLFQTGPIPLPASRFLCEHLRQKVFFWACISRIHAQVPVITTGKLAKTLRQQIPCSIDVAVVAGPAFRACPLSLIESQLIEGALAFRASLA